MLKEQAKIRIIVHNFSFFRQKVIIDRRKIKKVLCFYLN